MLSTTNWCGREYPAPGIPQLTPRRWINPADGTMTVDGRQIRPGCAAVQRGGRGDLCPQDRWVDTTGSDGRHRPLPAGQARRELHRRVFSNLGTDYVDVNRPADPPEATRCPTPKSTPSSGNAIDCLMKRLCSRTPAVAQIPTASELAPRGVQGASGGLLLLLFLGGLLALHERLRGLFFLRRLLALHESLRGLVLLGRLLTWT